MYEHILPWDIIAFMKICDNTDTQYSVNLNLDIFCQNPYWIKNQSLDINNAAVLKCDADGTLANVPPGREASALDQGN